MCRFSMACTNIKPNPNNHTVGSKKKKKSFERTKLFSIYNPYNKTQDGNGHPIKPPNFAFHTRQTHLTAHFLGLSPWLESSRVHSEWIEFSLWPRSVCPALWCLPHRKPASVSLKIGHQKRANLNLKDAITMVCRGDAKFWSGEYSEILKHNDALNFGPAVVWPFDLCWGGTPVFYRKLLTPSSLAMLTLCTGKPAICCQFQSVLKKC